MQAGLAATIFELQKHHLAAELEFETYLDGTDKKPQFRAANLRLFLSLLVLTVTIAHAIPTCAWKFHAQFNQELT